MFVQLHTVLNAAVLRFSGVCIINFQNGYSRRRRMQKQILEKLLNYPKQIRPVN